LRDSLREKNLCSQLLARSFLRERTFEASFSRAVSCAKDVRRSLRDARFFARKFLRESWLRSIEPSVPARRFLARKLARCAISFARFAGFAAVSETSQWRDRCAVSRT
jgi:hypothetical protein